MSFLFVQGAKLLPFDISILGIPISSQTSSRNGKKKKRIYKDRIFNQAKSKLAEDFKLITENVKLKLVYFYDESTDLDADNIIKPIQDALEGVIYANDNQVVSIECKKKNLNGNYRMRGVITEELFKGFSSDEEFVYILVEFASNEEELL